MKLKPLILLTVLSFSLSPKLSAAIIAVDGASGFMGSELVRILPKKDIHIGIRRVSKFHHHGDIYIGNTFDPVYLKKILNNVEIFYQMASIVAVRPQNTLNEYILTNSVGPYLASRINKNMSMLSFSSIAIYDVVQTAELKIWIDRFVQHYSKVDCNLYTSQADVQRDLDDFMANSNLPEVSLNQYYGLSKLLLEKLLEMSSKTRTGHLYLIRPALIVGEDMRQRSGNNVLKDLMDAIFFSRQTYEVWNRLVYYTPSKNLTRMMLYITQTPGIFGKYEVFDSGWVPMQQHDFVYKLFSEIKSTPPNIKLVNFSGFDRKVELHEDARVKQFYPQLADVNQAIIDMVAKYQEENN